MKTGLLCLAVGVVLAGGLCSWAGADEVDIRYALTIDRPETGVGYVKATISGLSADGFTLLRPGAAGTSWFDGVKATDASGEEVPVTEVEGGWYVTSRGSARVNLSYSIYPGTPGAYGHIGLICAEYAALDGSLVFLVPEEAHRIKSAQLLFSGPEEWRGISGWSAAGGLYKADEDFAPLRQQLARSLFCFGNFRRISKGFGTNTLSVHLLDSYPEEHRRRLADGLQKIYRRTYELLGFETGREYHVVCLPVGPDGLPVAAGAWADGMAVTLSGLFETGEANRHWQNSARFMMAGYFVEKPFGVTLSYEDRWFYPAVVRWAEGDGLIAVGRTNENVFYAGIYSDYAAEATKDSQSLDVPFGGAAQTLDEAAFLRETKAPILAMRLDFAIRTATENAKTLESLISAVYAQGGTESEPVSILEVLYEMTGYDFEEIYERFVRRRDLILPLWPALVRTLKKQADELHGPVVAEVDGMPIYQREVTLLASTVIKEGKTEKSSERAWETALAVLRDEKLMDKALVQRRVDLQIPKEFRQMRTSLPGRLMRLVITKKRQAVKEIMYQEWLRRERAETPFEVSEDVQRPGKETR